MKRAETVRWRLDEAQAAVRPNQTYEVVPTPVERGEIAVRVEENRLLTIVVRTGPNDYLGLEVQPSCSHFELDKHRERIRQ